MSFLDFKNSKLSCVENDFYRTDVKLNIITEKINEIILNNNNKDNETIKDKLNNIIYKLNKLIIKPNDIINEFKIDKPDYIIFGLQKLVDEIERIIFNAETTGKDIPEPEIVEPEKNKIIESEII